MTLDALHSTVRYVGLALLALGITFWTGHATALVPLHMLLGLLLVLALWGLAWQAGRAGVVAGFVGFVYFWGFVVLALGLTQAKLVPGGAHWIVQLLHLLAGLLAIGQGEGLYYRARRLTRMVPA